MIAPDTDVRRGSRTGRPRSEAADTAILQATLHLVRERGYAGVTVAAVIEQAGVSSATLYRRWATKHELVVAALEHVKPDTAIADTGTLAGDVRAFVDNMKTAIDAGWVDLAQAIGVAAKHDAALDAALRDRFLAPRTAELDALLDRAHARGELTVVPPAQMALSLIVGPFHHWAIQLGEPTTEEFLAAACRFAVAGLQAIA